jgi:predicted amidohydrolase
VTTVACRQLAPTLGDLAGNHARVVAAIEDASAGGVDVLVLPELATSGYAFATPEELSGCAIGLDDPRIAEWSRAVRGNTVVVVGFAECGPDGVLYNSAVLLDAQGVRAHYRKAHLWDREKLLFTSGDERAPVVDTAHGRIGLLICYDLEFPEYTRALALAGADLLAVPTNWPLVPRPEGERPPEVLIAQATARVNHVFVACCDRAGTERGLEWTSGTCIVDEQGFLATRIGGAQAAELDLDRARDKTLSEYAHAWADRRPELY